LIEGSSGRLELSRVFGEGWRMLTQRWGAMLAALALFGWAPQIVGNFAYLQITHLVTAGSAESIANFAIFGFINLAAPLVLRAVTMAMALRPPTTSIGTATAAVLKAAPALAPIWLFSLAVSSALLALQYAGAVRQYGWMLAAVGWPLGLLSAVIIGIYSPVVLAEGLGPVAAVRRSFTLLSGSRWKFVALYLVAQLIAVAPRFAAQLVGLAPLDTETIYLADLVAGQLGLDAVLVWWSAVAVAAYLELARLREGLVPRDVVEVFA
jgi:hypothetical protein